jgi:exonuclease SbcD
LSIATFPPGFGYLALGHLHRAQQVGTNPPAWYSGSPLMLSFSEQYDKKQVNILEISGERISVTNVKIPAFRKLFSLKGALSAVKEKLDALQQESPLGNWIELNVEESVHDPLLIRLFDDFIEDFNLKNEKSRIIKNIIRFTDRPNPEAFSENSGLTLSDFNEVQVFEKLLEQEGIVDRETLLTNFNQLLQMLYSNEHQE